MSRSGYSNDLDLTEWSMICWRGAVQSATNGRRGQAFLREMLVALDAMPEKRLITEDLVREDGEVCAIGAVCKARGLDVSKVDPGDPFNVAASVGIARALACEIEWENDSYHETPEGRWTRMRRWVEKQIKPVEPRLG